VKDKVDDASDSLKDAVNKGLTPEPGEPRGSPGFASIQP
jgi:hypothetical protein